MHKIDPIDKNPLVIIVTLLTIYQELLPSIIDVGLITPCELFKTLFMGTAVAESNDILFKVRGNVFEFIQTDFNNNICISTHEKSDEVKAWKKKLKAEARELRLTSNCLLLHISTKQYPPSAREGSSKEIGYMECLLYSEPRLSSLV